MNIELCFGCEYITETKNSFSIISNELNIFY